MHEAARRVTLAGVMPKVQAVSRKECAERLQKDLW